MRTRRCLGVILDGKERMLKMGQTFDRLIIQVDVGDCSSTLERVYVNTKPVVLGRNFNFSSSQIHNRMIAAVVSKLELIRLSAECQTHNLVPKTNPKNRDFSNQGSHILYGIRHRIRVSRTI